MWRLEALPYLLLLLATLCGWLSVRISLGMVLLAVASGLYTAKISWIALPSIAILGTSLWLPSRFALDRFARAACYAVFFIFAVLMSNYVLPGFNNLPIFVGHQFSPDSLPFSMYLNFDKTLVGIFLLLFFVGRRIRVESFGVASFALLALVALMLPLALLIHYVRVDVKFPEYSWLWILNNLFFVCLAEEGLFRGFIQGGLERLLPSSRRNSFIAIGVAAVLFGLAHYHGGVAYMLLAGIAGMFYGYVYWRTRELTAAMFVHFGLNLIHFVFFSYPALVPNYVGPLR